MREEGRKGEGEAEDPLPQERARESEKATQRRMEPKDAAGVGEEGRKKGGREAMGPAFRQPDDDNPAEQVCQSRPRMRYMFSSRFRSYMHVHSLGENSGSHGLTVTLPMTYNFQKIARMGKNEVVSSNKSIQLQFPEGRMLANNKLLQTCTNQKDKVKWKRIPVISCISCSGQGVKLNKVLCADLVLLQ